MKSQIIIKSIYLLLILTSISISQQMKIISGGEVTFIQEIMGLVEFKNEKLKISSIRSKSENINLKVSDEILYVNGNRVKTLESFKEHYENIKIGNQVKLGVQRAENMLIASFTKKDPSKSKHKIMRIEGNGEGKTPQKVEMKNGKVIMDGKEVSIDSLKKSGVRIKTKSVKQREQKWEYISNRHI